MLRKEAVREQVRQQICSRWGFNSPAARLGVIFPREIAANKFMGSDANAIEHEDQEVGAVWSLSSEFGAT